jgi:murein DD-endopeptidase MepM/ murein hydrolase activator NlpD
MVSPFLCKCKVTQEFGANPANYAGFGLKGHEGVDYVPVDPFWGVHAIEAGSVVLDHDERDTAYGNSVRVQSADGRVLLYAHLSENVVNLGDEVEAGQLLGIMGNTGNSHGAHLHLSVYHVDILGQRLNIDNGFKGMLDPEKEIV